MPCQQFLSRSTFMKTNSPVSRRPELLAVIINCLMTSEEAHTAMMRDLEAAFFSKLSNTVAFAASSSNGMWEMFSFRMPPMYL